MSPKALIVLCVIFLISQIACADPQVEPAHSPAEAETPAAVVQASAASQTDPAELLRNGKMPFEGVLVGGQPTAEQFETLASLGYGTVVNLRGPQEGGQEDPSLVESLGMKYVALPISSNESLNEQNALALAQVLNNAQAPVLVHCASGNRVGALFALKAYYADGKTPEEALAIAKEAGITRLEPVLKQKLGLE